MIYVYSCEDGNMTKVLEKYPDEEFVQAINRWH